MIWDHLRASPFFFPQAQSPGWIAAGGLFVRRHVGSCGQRPGSRVFVRCRDRHVDIGRKYPLATEHGIATMFLPIRLLEGMTMDIHLFFPSPMFKTKSRVRITILVGNSGSLLVNLPSGYLAVCYGKWSIYGWITMNYLYLPTKNHQAVSFVLQNPISSVTQRNRK